MTMQDKARRVSKPLRSTKDSAKIFMKEMLNGDCERIELLAREQREGRTAWGNQLTKGVQHKLHF